MGRNFSMIDLFEELGDALRPSVIEPLEAKAMPNPQPTEDEIKAIIRHHVGLLRMIDESWAMGQTGSWEIRQYPYSNQRINYYSQYISETDIQAIFLDVYEGFDEWLLENSNLPDDIHDRGSNSHFND